MKKIILLLMFLVGTMLQAQDDTCFVFVDYQGQEYEYMFKSVDIANQYLAMTFDTTHGSYSAEFTLLTEYQEKIGIPLQSENLVKSRGDNRNKVFSLKPEFGKKLKKAKKDKKDKP